MTDFPTLDSFREWLAGREPDAQLAQGWDAHSCPLCVFLADLGLDSPFVGATHWGHGGMRFTGLQVPAWAQEFVYWIDKTKPRTATAAECLHVIDQPFFRPGRWTA